MWPILLACYKHTLSTDTTVMLLVRRVLLSMLCCAVLYCAVLCCAEYAVLCCRQSTIRLCQGPCMKHSRHPPCLLAWPRPTGSIQACARRYTQTTQGLSFCSTCLLLALCNAGDALLIWGLCIYAYTRRNIWLPHGAVFQTIVDCGHSGLGPDIEAAHSFGGYLSTPV